MTARTRKIVAILGASAHAKALNLSTAKVQAGLTAARFGQPPSGGATSSWPCRL